MKRIVDTVRDIISSNPVLRFGFHHRLLNMSQVARFIHPLVETSTNKKVSASAIQMVLSRLKVESDSAVAKKPLRLDKITLLSGLGCCSFHKTPLVISELSNLASEINEAGSLISIFQGVDYVLMIFDDEKFKTIIQLMSEEPAVILRDVAAVCVCLEEDLMNTPGIIYKMLELLVFQNINVIEISSTAREYLFFVREKDAQQTFDTLYSHFAKRRPKNGNDETNDQVH